MSDYERFKNNINQLIDINLSYYKEAQMKRRLKSLMTRNKFDSFDDFFVALNNDSELLSDFIDYLTINVSEFYRNPEQWEILEKNIVPSLIKKNPNKLRVWSAACSTGEEPYSLVMLLSKYFSLNEIQILATDIDEAAIEKAKEGIYSKAAIKNVPYEYKKKYFQKEGDMYKISDKIVDRVKFKQLDLLKDKFPEEMDLISCRNVMIYFTDTAKNKLYNKFNKALKPEGVFFVGSTEQIIMPEKFNFKTNKTFFYNKIN